MDEVDRRHRAFYDAEVRERAARPLGMHLGGDGFDRALAEIGRVAAPGALVAVGVWGAGRDDEWTDPHGRRFRHRTDEDVRARLGSLGRLLEFEAWEPYADDVHYQLALVRVDG
ncbi:hypothetical protein [Phycicoccus flavus]|uniref:hypothetical protein n=1 Tax=Phycicoccus flavus TaxID=2502783 RepID=UPI000FEB7801|nr:hypothetical protein [Phycicoccus flavus]NHA69533.1 hypothetical protein [Phycicoccus flavus]